MNTFVWSVVPGVLDALARGRVIRSIIVWGLRVASVLTGIAGAVAVVLLVGLTTQTRSPAFILAALVAILGVVAATIAIIQIILYRAGTVSALQDTAFTVIPCLSVLVRMWGEVLAAYFVFLGVTVGLGSMLAPAFAGRVTEFLPMGTAGAGGLVGGVGLLVVSAIAAFSAILLSYASAETLLLLPDIAANVRSVAAGCAPAASAASRPSSQAPSRGAAPAAIPMPMPAQPVVAEPPPPPPPPPRPAPACGHCGQPLVAGVRFCRHCGRPAV